MGRKKPRNGNGSQNNNSTSPSPTPKIASVVDRLAMIERQTAIIAEREFIIHRVASLLSGLVMSLIRMPPFLPSLLILTTVIGLLQYLLKYILSYYYHADLKVRPVLELNIYDKDLTNREVTNMLNGEYYKPRIDIVGSSISTLNSSFICGTIATHFLGNSRDKATYVAFLSAMTSIASNMTLDQTRELFSSKTDYQQLYSILQNLKISSKEWKLHGLKQPRTFANFMIIIYGLTYVFNEAPMLFSLELESSTQKSIDPNLYSFFIASWLEKHLNLTVCLVEEGMVVVKPGEKNYLDIEGLKKRLEADLIQLKNDFKNCKRMIGFIITNLKNGNNNISIMEKKIIIGAIGNVQQPMSVAKTAIQQLLQDARIEKWNNGYRAIFQDIQSAENFRGVLLGIGFDNKKVEKVKSSMEDSQEGYAIDLTEDEYNKAIQFSSEDHHEESSKCYELSVSIKFKYFEHERGDINTIIDKLKREGIHIASETTRSHGKSESEMKINIIPHLSTVLREFTSASRHVTHGGKTNAYEDEKDERERKRYQTSVRALKFLFLKEDSKKPQKLVGNLIDEEWYIEINGRTFALNNEDSVFVPLFQQHSKKPFAIALFRPPEQLDDKTRKTFMSILSSNSRAVGGHQGSCITWLTATERLKILKNTGINCPWKLHYPSNDRVYGVTPTDKPIVVNYIHIRKDGSKVTQTLELIDFNAYAAITHPDVKNICQHSLSLDEFLKTYFEEMEGKKSSRSEVLFTG